MVTRKVQWISHVVVGVGHIPVSSATAVLTTFPLRVPPLVAAVMLAGSGLMAAPGGSGARLHIALIGQEADSGAARAPLLPSEAGASDRFVPPALTLFENCVGFRAWPGITRAGQGIGGTGGPAVPTT